MGEGLTLLFLAGQLAGSSRGLPHMCLLVAKANTCKDEIQVVACAVFIGL